MPTIEESIPAALEAEVAAARRWFNAQEQVPFEVTGILDPDEAVVENDSRVLRLILCGGDRCEQRSFRVVKTAEGFDVSFEEDAVAFPDAAVEPRMDPPPGVRVGWLDRALAQHAFVVLVFYRGFW